MIFPYGFVLRGAWRGNAAERTDRGRGTRPDRLGALGFPAGMAWAGIGVPLADVAGGVVAGWLDICCLDAHPIGKRAEAVEASPRAHAREVTATPPAGGGALEDPPQQVGQGPLALHNVYAEHHSNHGQEQNDEVKLPHGTLPQISNRSCDALEPLVGSAKRSASVTVMPDIDGSQE